ncbi:ribonuclease P protein subunit [Candidatus Woesearchaeota archaeon]|nr:ribonuclease P protein subunit [Candidatus Woesearchaeota archaeon]
MNEKIPIGEFIGRKVRIQYNKKEFEGIIIDETKNTFALKTLNGVKKIIKNNAIIEIDRIQIHGKNLMKRPEDRIKM